MRSNLETRPRSKQRGPKYKAEFDHELAKIWEATDYVCPEQLTPNLVELAEKLASHQELRLTPTLKQQLEQVSVANRNNNNPCNNNNNIGFRCAGSAPIIILKGQVRWVYGRVASAERDNSRTVPG
ncbi:MAG: hypothetical protein P1S60_01105 [Anaerolineae bacterium]|nr:hypothetical protein [Anaerolineae bacterium]